MVFSLKLNKKIYLFILGIIILGFIINLYFKQELTIPISSEKFDMNFIVVIDAGHGSIDTGASYENILEKEINLKISKYLKAELKKVNIIPVLSRRDDSLYENSRRKDLRHRPEVAKQHNADLFISIHANKYPSSQPAGSQIFYKLNSPASKELAETVQKKLVALRQENDRSLKTGDFYVLNHSPCPAILIETGFLSNAQDREKLTNSNYQQALAQAIKKGIVNYFLSSLENIEETMTSTSITPDTKTVIYQEKGPFLYFLASNQKYFLIRKELSLPSLNLPIDKNRTLNEILVYSAIEQLKTPKEGLISPLPEGTKVNSIIINQKKLSIDFSKEIQTNFNGGAQLEKYTIKAISKTLFSLPNIVEIEILIAGNRNDSIGGHIILNNIKKQEI